MPALPALVGLEKSHSNPRKFFGLFSLWQQHLLGASIVQNCCCRSSALRLHFIVTSIKFPLPTFGLRAFAGRISQLLSIPFIRVTGFWVGGEMAINQVKAKERRFLGSHTDWHTSGCPQLYLLTLWPLSEIHVITQLNDFRGGILSLSPWHRKMDAGKQAGWAPVHHLYEQIEIGFA